MGMFEKRRFRNFLMYLASYHEDEPGTFQGGFPRGPPGDRWEGITRAVRIVFADVLQAVMLVIVLWVSIALAPISSKSVEYYLKSKIVG